jgi:hypothetical protein
VRESRSKIVGVLRAAIAGCDLHDAPAFGFGR